MPLSFYDLARSCAPGVHPATLQRVVQVESSFNPYAVGVVKGRLARQPKSLDEAKSTVAMLEAAGYNYSLGLSQVNKKNLKAYGLTIDSAFDPCENLRAGSEILIDCYRSAGGVNRDPQSALRDALSCYYTGDPKRGHGLGYVARIERAVTRHQPGVPVNHLTTRLPKLVEAPIPPPDIEGVPPNPAPSASSLLF